MIKAIIFDCFGVLYDEQSVRNDILLRYIHSLRPEYRIGMLSNIDEHGMEKYFSAPERAKLFDEVILSGNVGLSKPDPKIFELACDRLGVLPREAVMVDDLELNVTGACTAGLVGIVFQDATQCRAELAALLTKTPRAK